MKFVLPFPLFFLLTLLFLVSCSGGNKAEQGAAPVPVAVGSVRHVEDYQTVPVSGSVLSPDGPSHVSFLVSGRVTTVGPREGEFVRKGQLLASIDAVDYRLGLSAAEAQLGAAKVAFERAEDEYRRMSFLYESKSLAPNDFQKFKAVRDAAKEQLDQAAANRDVSRKRLSDATLSAPIDGFVARRAIEPGEMAAAGNPVFSIVRLDPVEADVGVPETDIGLVRVGQKASVTIPALPGRSFEGMVRIVNVAADPATRTYMARIRIRNPAHLLRIGMVAEARIRGDRKVAMMTLPGDAIVRDPQGATIVFIYFPDKGRVYAKRVETGTVRDRDVEIKSGLSGDESVVVAGQDRLRDGIPVTVTGPAPASAPRGVKSKE
jgi:membrane fusion protein (multidrug efflux system)